MRISDWSSDVCSSDREWVSEFARGNPDARIALVAATVADGQRVMIAGPSGLIAVARAHEEARWVVGRRELVFASGARSDERRVGKACGRTCRFRWYR